jgi:magnesium chelatase family protein
MHIEVPPLRYGELLQQAPGESSATIRERVIAARGLQYQRFGQAKTNALLNSAEIKLHCQLTQKGSQLLQMVLENMGLSARACNRILRVARTIADLEGSPTIQEAHLLEAVNLRNGMKA